MNIRDQIRKYDRLWGRDEPRLAGRSRRRLADPLTTFRDWWHQPVTDRLDRIEASTRPSAPSAAGWGSRSVMLRDGTTAGGLARAVNFEVRRSKTGRHTWPACDRDLGWDFESRIGYYCDRAPDHDGPHRALGEWFDDDGDRVDPPSPGLASIREMDNARPEPTSLSDSVCMCSYDGLNRSYRCRGCRAGFGPDVETLRPAYPRTGSL